MGGVLDIREGVSWLPQGWVYRDVQADLSIALKEQDVQLSILLDQSTVGIDYCSIVDLEANRFQLLLRCFECLYQSSLEREDNFSEQSTKFKPYFAEVCLLKTLLRTDPRSGEDLCQLGRFLLRDNAAWEAPLWVYDFVLEQWAAAERVLNSGKAHWLLSYCSSHDRNECDLTELQNEEFQLLLAHTDYMAQRYSGKLEADATGLLAERGSYLQILKELMQSDPRAQPGI